MSALASALISLFVLLPAPLTAATLSGFITDSTVVDVLLIVDQPLPDQQGFGGLVGDNFERPFFGVEGGTGLYGSAAADWLGFAVHARGE